MTTPPDSPCSTALTTAKSGTLSHPTMTRYHNAYGPCNIVDLKENILVLDGDRFVEDPVLVLRSVERFLHLPPFFSHQHFTFSGTFTSAEVSEFDISLVRAEGFSLLQAGRGEPGPVYGERQGKGPPGVERGDSGLSQEEVQSNVRKISTAVRHRDKIIVIN